MKTILVPTDFSITADYAIRYAFKLAESLDASIILYHAFTPFESGFYSLEQSKEENLETEKNLLKRLSVIKDKILRTRTNDKANVSIHVDRGPSSIRLIEYCKKEAIDLIVMGTTGASGLKEVVIGSFTADMMTKAPCPVLAVPENYEFKIPEIITFASDFHSKDTTAIKYLAELNSSFNAKIGILHIDDSDQTAGSEERLFAKFKEKIQSQCEGIPLSFQHVVAKDVATAIVKMAQNDDTDMLAMSPVKREGFWDCIMNRSVTKAIAYQIPIPLLSIPALKR